MVTLDRNLKFLAGPSLLKSKYRYLSRTSSEILPISPLSTGKGKAAASLKTLSSSQTTSISPVGISLFSCNLSFSSPLSIEPYILDSLGRFTF